MCEDKKPGMDHEHGHKKGCHGKRVMHEMDKGTLEFLIGKTFKKIAHQSEADLKSGAATAALTEEEKAQLRTLLNKILAAIKAEPKEAE